MATLCAILPGLNPDIGLGDGIQLNDDQYLICYGKNNTTSRVSVVDVNGRVLRSSNLDVGLFHSWRMAVDADKFAFVSDLRNNHVVLFDSSLSFVRNVTEGLTNRVSCLCFDDVTRRLYLAQKNNSVVVLQM